MSPLDVDLLEGGVAFAGMRGEWRALAAEASGTVFLRWEWLFPWWSQLAYRDRPVLLTARDGTGRLRGLLPLLERRGGRFLRRRWSLLGGRWVGSDGLGPLLSPRWEEAAGLALARRLAGEAGRWSMLRFSGLPAQSPWVATLRHCLRQQGVPSWLRAGDLCRVIELGSHPDPLDGNPRRATFERRRRFLERQPSFQLDCASEGPSIADALTAFLALHDLRWHAESDAIPSAAVVRFHREAAALMATEGLCRIYLLRLNGRPVAGLHALVDRRTFYYYLPVLDPAWAHRSVGTVLLGLVVERARREGFTRFELLRGEEPYKADWSGACWRTVSLEAAAPDAVAWTVGHATRWQRGLRTLASEGLPSEIVGRWRAALSRLSLRASDLG
ncbi:MAG TPA: GNAT family N-acetyltransferase [Myxococcales bacterium]|nr:GNAT family N-acetyltransferase [Myxococcales bacterium]